MSTQAKELNLYRKVANLRPFLWPDYHRVSKRILDVLLSLIILILAAPLLLLIAAGIKLHSPGPVFFRQKRIGKNGVPFEMLKFRSMRLGCSAQDHKQHVQQLIRENISPRHLGCKSLKLAGDPRITGLGRILRKLSLDEMPQFINVLRGQMSIVGPRPPLPYEYEIYADWHKQRLSVAPGITGAWQVFAHNQVCFDDMVRLDLDYIRQMSLWLDLKIMFLTPWEMIRGKGGG